MYKNKLPRTLDNKAWKCDKLIKSTVFVVINTEQWGLNLVV